MRTLTEGRTSIFSTMRPIAWAVRISGSQSGG